MINVVVDIYSESHHPLPDYARLFDSGMDLQAYLPNGSLLVPADQTVIVPTGLYVAIPPGYEFQIRPRSGTSYKTRLRISNPPGTIDSGYRGELGILLDNHGSQLSLSDGDRVAQMVLAPVIKCVWNQVTNKDLLGSTDRGEGGFGSTGHN